MQLNHNICELEGKRVSSLECVECRYYFDVNFVEVGKEIETHSNNF